MQEVENLRNQKRHLEDRLAGKTSALERGFIIEDIPQGDNAAQGSTMKPVRDMKVCEVCGALQSVADTEDRLQMHLEGKLHQGYLKIREKLKDLRAKRAEERRKGLDRVFPTNQGNREAQKRQIAKALEEEAKEHFNYSSQRWGSGVNMPKFTSIYDQSKVRYADRVI